MGGILSDMEDTLQSGDVEVLRQYVNKMFVENEQKIQQFKNDIIKHQRLLSAQMSDITREYKALHNITVAQFNLLSKAKQVFGEVIRGTLSYKATENKGIKGIIRQEKSDDTCIVAIDKDTLLHMQALFNDINYTIGTYAPLESEAFKQTRMPYPCDENMIE